MMRILIVLMAVFLLNLPQAHATMADIETAIMNKDYVQAKSLAANVLRTTSVPAQRIEAEYYFGLAQLRLGQYADARKAFGIVMAASTTQDMYDKAGLGAIDGLYMAGFYKDALKAEESLLKKSPKSQFLSSIYLKIARANLKLMRWTKANEYLTRIMKEFPQSFEAPIAKQLLEEKEYFTVQVGSFLDQGRAIALTNELKSTGQYAYIVETTSPDGQKFYRVRVGQLTSLQDAKSLENHLAKLGYPTLIYP